MSKKPHLERNIIPLTEHSLEYVATNIMNSMPKPKYEEMETREPVYRKTIREATRSALREVLRVHQALNKTLGVHERPPYLANGATSTVFRLNDKMVLRVQPTRQEDCNAWASDNVSNSTLFQTVHNTYDLQQRFIETADLMPKIHGLGYAYDVGNENDQLWSLQMTNTRIHIEAFVEISDFVEIVGWHRWNRNGPYSNNTLHNKIDGNADSMQRLKRLIADMLISSQALIDMGIYLIDPSGANIVLTKKGVRYLDYHDSCVPNNEHAEAATNLCQNHMPTWFTMLPELRVYVGEGDWSGVKSSWLIQSCMQMEPNEAHYYEADTANIMNEYLTIARQHRQFKSTNINNGTVTHYDIDSPRFDPLLKTETRYDTVFISASDKPVEEDDVLRRLYPSVEVPIPAPNDMFTPSYQRQRYIFLLAEMIRMTLLENIYREQKNTGPFHTASLKVDQGTYDQVIDILKPMWHPNPHERRMPYMYDIQTLLH